ncbi:UbiH/UbiF family hydroxylase [Aquitalea magnusonii]|uniref:2-octaprenyl-3-methyl-6-methoxy-1,4-benzoquinol hydroxylase n=2 Tax=Aquitalea magnusonii TaxID=332411 RepID=A0A318JQX9_9NEIS|nr:UbiH/UbiF family hydroxylase [Aquitalea magnusonii]PXX50658.1 2-octaprenyl-3-methyl-6-methoxy-1,4-benzoquinol hydroxylase [Aquitalea magnusonii]
MTQYDVIIVGGGLVGASLALALADSGKKIALLEGSAARFDDLEQGWDARIYAVSPLNRRFLEQLQAWPDMARIGTIASMDVRGDAGGRIQFAASDADASALAWIVENRWLLASLWQRLRHSSVDCFTGVRPLALETTATAACLRLDDGRELRSRLVVGADGANSWVRQQTGLAASIKPYGQSGVVANFACEKPHGDIARQWFTGDSILAWLPMAGNRISMVWSTADADALLALSAEQLCARVAAAGDHQLGHLSLLGPAAAFPLRLIQPAAVVSQRLALVGDAAHTVHPLAGQGVNLGFQDAAQLAALLASASDAGDWMLLRRYERSRREAVKTMQFTCDSLYRLFHTEHLPGLSWLRNTGLTLTNRLTPLKRQFARHAIGF